MKIEKEFDELPIPNSAKEHSYTAFNVNEYSHIKIGKDSKENPSLLIFLPNQKDNFKVSKYKLYNLKITHNLVCEVITKNKREEHVFSLISFSGDDIELKKYFIRICEILIPTLGAQPDKNKITVTVNKFIELFKALKEPPQKTLQGLWTELFLIHQSNNPKKLIKAWHTMPEEKYDFSSEKLRIEVKSSSTGTRVHYFSLEQLNPPSNCKLFVVSILVNVLSGGISIEELVNDISKKLSDDTELIEKLNFITYSTIGSELSKIKNICFDYEAAVESLKIYDSEAIPSIQDIPSNIFEVKFKCSLQNIEPSSETISSLVNNFM
ncbi:PD-(D/E)XK motif protein [Pseudotenacibaculum haliotis]|uniref:PD-(D/E)XK motif protein n=1 Tax=Pseudotenacibaculum haliotis TaxID=1862138 RepID=A0ABW5LXI1_9FLAO